MSKLSENKTLVPEERIASKILLIRGEKIMLDFLFGVLYGIETRALKQAVKRNIERFPSDFMFELTENEINNLVSQNVIPSKSYLGGATLINRNSSNSYKSFLAFWLVNCVSIVLSIS